MFEFRQHHRKRILRNWLATILTTLACAGAASASQGNHPAYGWIEMARLHPWGVQVKAKLDSGALTSSMHAENIERFERGGDEWVRFSVSLQDQRSGKEFSKKFERQVLRNVIIRGAGGEERRPVVLMELCLGDTVYEEQFNIQDRSDMIYPILIGRRTIQHMGVIDVTRTFMNKPQCDENTTVSRYEDRRSDEDIGI